eukprot:COSAG02_NODE_8344_length_2604_cov_25.631521_4_plen_80_part_00
MKGREQRCSYNTQQMMKGAGGADTVEHDDHDDQIRDEEIENLQTQMRQCWHECCNYDLCSWLELYYCDTNGPSLPPALR